MEKSSDDSFNFLSVLPLEIYQEMTDYLDITALGFFAISYKQALKNILPSLLKHQTLLSKIELAAGGTSTYWYQAGLLFASGNHNISQLEVNTLNDCLTFTAMPLPTKVKQVSSGGSHSLILTDDNKLWVCGANYYGQLGLGHKEKCHAVTAVPCLSVSIKQVFAGFNHTLVLTEDNQLWACGNNHYGQLGLGHNNHCYGLTPVPLPGNIKRVLAGGSHTLVLTEDNKLWVCGANKYGQLGLGHYQDCNVLAPMSLPGKIKQIFVGALQTFVLTEDNQLWACGQNTNGQLGVGKDKDNYNTLTTVPLPGNLKQVLAGGNHTLIITDDDQLWVCGYNHYGQLGLGHKQNCFNFTATPRLGPVKQALAGMNHTIVITQDDKFWACGYNSYGQLGLGHKENCETFTLVKELPTTSPQMVSLSHRLTQLIALSNSTGNHQIANIMQSDKYQADGQPMLKRTRYK